MPSPQASGDSRSKLAVGNHRPLSPLYLKTIELLVNIRLEGLDDDIAMTN
jgi:hypothetical protein